MNREEFEKASICVCQESSCETIHSPSPQKMFTLLHLFKQSNMAGLGIPLLNFLISPTLNSLHDKGKENKAYHHEKDAPIRSIFIIICMCGASQGLGRKMVCRIHFIIIKENHHEGQDNKNKEWQDGWNTPNRYS